MLAVHSMVVSVLARRMSEAEHVQSVQGEHTTSPLRDVQVGRAVKCSGTCGLPWESRISLTLYLPWALISTHLRMSCQATDSEKCPLEIACSRQRHFLAPKWTLFELLKALFSAPRTCNFLPLILNVALVPG